MMTLPCPSIATRSLRASTGDAARAAVMMSAMTADLVMTDCPLEAAPLLHRFRMASSTTSPAAHRALAHPPFPSTTHAIVDSAAPSRPKVAHSGACRTALWQVPKDD